MDGIDPGARVAFVQNGDFRAAARRLEAGLGETYDAQRDSMEFVERLAAATALTAVISADSEDPHEADPLPSGVVSIGLAPIWAAARSPREAWRPVIAELERLAPSHVVLRLPSAEVLEWCLARGVAAFPCLADSFAPRPGLLRGWIDRRRTARLARLLNDPRVTCVGNHNVAAAEDLVRIGVDPARVVPWDWPRSPTPADFAPKAAPGPAPHRLICVGAVSAAKGVEEAIRALAVPGAPDATLDVVGSGEIEAMRALAARLGVADRVNFAGRVPHAEVAPRMRAADLVLVCSRHDYGEGLPGTIYLGLASRTPLVTSDHPMFVAYLKAGEDVAMVPARDAPALAAAIRALLADPARYATLSRGADAAFARICHPVLWADLTGRWLRDAAEDRAWIAANALPRWRRSTRDSA